MIYRATTLLSEKSVSFIAGTRTRMILAAACFAILFTTTANATNIVLNITDSAGEGLNDTTAISPVGGNNGTTVGEQRTIVFEYAAALIEQIINSNVTIVIDAGFDPLTPCSSTSGVIGQAGGNAWQANFSGTPLSNTWYPQALANSIASSDLSGSSDMSMTFNSSVDNNNSCLNNRNFYYGLDGNPGSDIDFLTTVLHEILHGLGFQTLVNLNTGAKSGSFNDVYMRHLEDHSLSDNWGDPTMNNSERANSATDDPDLHWTGPEVDANQGGLTGGSNQGHVRMHAPSSLSTGSSVSHFSTSLNPFELMEPVQTGPVENIGLARYLLEDIGWSVTASQNPIISEIDDLSILNAAADSVSFAVMDNDTSSASLSISATSSNTSIIDNANLVASGSGRIRQLDITPTMGMTGNVTITVTVDDGVNNNSTDFVVNVVSNLPPVVTINSPLDGTVFYDAPQSFGATATDPEQGDISSQITWTSSIDGSLAGGAAITPSLTDGVHQITASITDNDSNNDTDNINITVDLNGDADGDGLANQLEIVLGTNPENSDSDNDFMNDFDEVNQDGDPTNYTPGTDTDPNNPDTDGDSIPDGLDFDPLNPDLGAESVIAAPVWALLLMGITLSVIVSTKRRKIYSDIN